MLQRLPISFPRLIALIAMLNVAMSIPVSATVLDFDDRAFNEVLTGGSYGGLTWELGNAGIFGGSGQWAIPSLTGYYPHSGIHNVVNDFGSTLMGIGFPGPVNMNGAYIAVDGGSLAWAQKLRVHGFLQGTEVGVTDWFEPITTTPAWFDMSSLTNVDRILFETPSAFQNEAHYGMDDLTFTTIPEPTTLGILSIAGFALLTTRRRSK